MLAFTRNAVRRRPRARRAARLTIVLAVVLAVLPSAASANLGLAPGTEGFNVVSTNPDGTVDLLAGSHPFAMTTSLRFTKKRAADGNLVVTGGVKDVHLQLPSGMIGDPLAVPACSAQQFTTWGPPNTGLAELSGEHDSCPIDTQVGVAHVEISENGGFFTVTVGVYNLVPPPGVPAAVGFNVLGSPVQLSPSVRSNGDYGLSVDTRKIAEALTIGGVEVTLWGVPAEHSHDGEREPCLTERVGSCPVSTPPTAFWTLPTSCQGPQTSSLAVDSWEEPGSFAPMPGSLEEDGVPNLADPNWVTATSTTEDDAGDPSGYVGCSGLPFAPSLQIAPDTVRADTAAGLTATLTVPQEGLLSPEGRAAADLKDTTVTLPPGFAINPGQANGLVACQENQTGVGTEGPPSCPAASKVGTTEAETPLLHHKLAGDVYVLEGNPPNVRLLVDLEDKEDGTFIKLIGHVHLDENTGQLTATFPELPQDPISTFRLSFSGGAQAALVTPLTCGSYQTNTDFTPWSTPAGADVLQSSVFNITEGADGGPCTTPGFTPTLTAGSTTDQAGGFTSFSMLLQRADDQQRISTLQFKTPPGLLGLLSKVPLCPEPQAAQGTCSTASAIGHTVVEAGPGPNPLIIPEAGQPPAPIYLTGGYKGAPYGLSIAVPVIAGPFNLGTVVVRAKIDVDPHTAQLTITTDPLPSILDGVPTDLRTINAVIDHPEFLFNPTNCAENAFSGTATSTEGTTAPISTRSEVIACRSLDFKPKFTVSTSGETSKAKGASLDAKIVYPPPPSGTGQAVTQASIASVKVDLPKQLPSRLTTLQKACVASVFEADPAKCPAASVVGHATAVTPVLPVPLSGPAYFVSHGGEAFPSLIVVLQGYGVTVDLVGTTFISHAGITSSTFKQVPDVPITSFDLTLPEGKFSALAANGSLCTVKGGLKMPTAFTAQNGAVIKQSTKITVSGCAKAKAAAKKATKKSKSKPKSSNKRSK
jgi:hypothetical protein